MKFGDIPIEEAAGAILAHSIRLRDERIAKGKILTPHDAERLAAAGFRHVVAARIEDGDVLEDEAAGRIAQSLGHASLVVERAKTGRANVAAREPGVCLVDGDAVRRINGVHESLTLATVAPYTAVAAGQHVATAKIIPFAVTAERLDRAVAIAASQAPVLRVAPFTGRRTCVVFSELPTVPFKGRDKAERVLVQRLASVGGKLDQLEDCEHTAAALSDTLRRTIAGGSDLILMFGASAIVDRGDVIPDAIVRAGGEVRYFGMPVDPGNMLLLARIGDVDVVGLPGCARSPKLNGFDWVLQRLFARLPLGGDDIAAMGVGGLLG